MEENQIPVSARKETPRRAARKKQPGNAQRDTILAEHRGSMAGSARAIRTLAKCIQPVSSMDKSWCMGMNPYSSDRAGLGG